MQKSNPLRTILPKAVCILALILFFSCEQVVFDNPFAAGIDLEVNRPAVPTGIEVSAGDSSLLVTWSRIQGADSYQLFYGTTSNREQATAANDDNPRDTQCALTALTNETLYYLWLRSVNNAGNSDWSPYTIAIPTTFTQAPSTPSGLTLIAVDGGFYTLWEEAERAVYYEVWYSTTTNRSDGQMFLDADPTDHYCGIQGLTNGTTYNVWVRAINGFSQGEFSSAASGNPIPYSSGLLITAADTDFNYNKTNSLDVSLTFTEAVANSADMGVYDFSITGQNGEDYPVTAVSWNSARTQAVLTIDVSTVERESSEEWNVSLSGIQPVNSYSQIPWLHGSDLGFTVAIRSIDPPTGLDNDDIVIRSGGKSGTAFFYSGTFSEAFNSSSGYITDETLYIKVDPRSHRETENFTLHYTIDGGANWTPLTGGEALIPVPSSTIALDVEYIYDIRSHVKSDGFDVVEIPSVSPVWLA